MALEIPPVIVNRQSPEDILSLAAKKYKDGYIIRFPRCYAVSFLRIVIKVQPPILEQVEGDQWMPRLRLLRNSTSNRFARKESKGEISFHLQLKTSEHSIPLAWVDAIVLPNSNKHIRSISMHLKEDERISDLRSQLLRRSVKYTITTEAGFGDIAFGLAYQGILLYLIGLDPAAIGCQLHLSQADSARQEQIKSLELIINNSPRISESISALGGFLPEASTRLSIASLIIYHVLCSYLHACQHTCPSHVISVVGGAGAYESMCRMFKHVYRGRISQRKQGQRLFSALDKVVFSSIFRTVDQSTLSAGVNDSRDHVVCHYRLGDTARITILGVDFIPHFLDKFPDSHARWVQSTPHFRRNDLTIESIANLTVQLFPGKRPILLSDGFSHAREILLKPTNISIISRLTGKGIALVTEHVLRALSQAEADLEQNAQRIFGKDYSIGSTVKHNNAALDIIMRCSGAISSSGHFCYAIMNFISRHPQVLYAKQEGDRYSITRRGLTLLPLPIDVKGRTTESL